MSVPSIAPKPKGPTNIPSPSSAPSTFSPTGTEAYTVPTILLPSSEAISDSLAIAQWAETHHPSPSLHLSETPHTLAATLISQATFPLIPVFMPLIPRTILRSSSIPHFLSIRAARFGMPLDELEATRGGEQAWAAAKPGLDALEKFVGGEWKVDAGRWVLGSRVSYADFMVGAVLEGFRRVDCGIFERVLEEREALRGVWEGCEREGWLERHD
jgi:glutathione S-transferase